MKLQDIGWTVEKVKDQGFDWFCKNIDLMVEAGTIDKPSKADVRKLFEKLTGQKLKIN